MSTHAPIPSTWQETLGRQLAQALTRGLGAQPPARDGAPADAEPLRSHWRVARQAQGAALSPTLQALAHQQAGDAVGRARAGSLLTRCLQHYREQIRPDDEAEDDAGVALACFLAACVQAQEGRAVTPERWRAVHDWILAWAADGLDWDAVPAGEQAAFFERMASLAVAIGEWSVVASRQGAAAVRSAQMLARSSLQGQLGLEIEALSAVLRALDASAAGSPFAAKPS